AIDGAAEKRPENRLGFSISARSANATTNSPPFRALSASGAISFIPWTPSSRQPEPTPESACTPLITDYAPRVHQTFNRDPWQVVRSPETAGGRRAVCRRRV